MDGGFRDGRIVSPRLLYRTLAIAEAVTWTMLIVGMILKYVVQSTDVGVSIGGAAHGIVFVAFCMGAVLVGINQHWSLKTIVLSLVTAVVPYATIPMDRHLERTRQLEGTWRRVATDDPRDHRPLNRLLRWFVNHPALLVTIFVVLLVGIVTVLLIAGPPVGD
ncbi:DUF3817 domain-containing protein [Marisediminicola senii]|uniref:DUF3817 domain-containing protein n=1 Tax=Marisediminicola senii TaxID=2711233 RepID=UPI001F3BADAC|nr:DUF3817 domain-containing protein [Marisediminicola senii]